MQMKFRKAAIAMGVLLGVTVPFGAMSLSSRDAEATILVYDQKNVEEAIKEAVQTAKIVVPDLEPVIDERLIEMDYGPYEGTDLNRLPPEILFFFRDFVHNPAPEGMEQLSSVTERAGSFLDRIRLLQGNILISTHAIAMKGLLETLTPESNGSFWSQFIGNCAIYAAENGGGRIGIPRELKSME